MAINDRFMDAVEHLIKTGKFKKYKQFYSRLGWDANRFQYVKGTPTAKLGIDEIEKLNSFYPEINWKWVGTGTGQMLKEYPDGKTSERVKEPPTIYGVPAGELNEKETEIIRIVMGTSEMSCNDQLALMREAWLFQNNKITKYAELIEKL